MFHLCALSLVLAAPPTCTTEDIFPPEHWHNHASCLVECPNGDLLVCWYNGSGERSADDVKVEGARKRKGATTWSPRFLLADTPGFPDTNPCLFIDPRGRLWLIWQTIVANEWHTALTRYRIASSYDQDGPPRWEVADTLLLKPGSEFTTAIVQQCDASLARLDQVPAEQRDRLRAYLTRLRQNAGDRYFSRMGWMTRAHPLALDERRLIVPLYSDGYSLALMALSDDGGATWTASAPLVSHGGVQPTLVRKKDGTLVVYLRDNGPPPKRLLVCESADHGRTWGPVRDTDLPNPGSGAEVLGLRSGRWLLIYNDTERGRHSLAVSLSDDEGKTWKWTRHLERTEPGVQAGSYSYPSVIQAQDGTLHATYTYAPPGLFPPAGPTGRTRRECIRHAHFSEEWILAGP